jgi:outer membrane protein assembly factor BamB
MSFLRFVVLPGAWLALLVWSTASVPAADPSADWSQWRGPTRDGITTGPAWPASLKDDALKQTWRVELGPSYSGPLVDGERVYVTETVDRSKEVVRALDRATGKELWKAEWNGALTVPFFAKANGDWIRATPASDGESLYVAGMRDVLVCLDAKTGAERWRVDFTERYKTPLPAFGFVSSPLVDGDALYVQAGASVLRLDKKTGETVWRVLKDDGGMSGSAFSSPTLGALQGKRQLLVQTRTKLAGLDPATGAALWEQEVPAFRGMNILTPVVYDDGVFTSCYQGKSYFFRIKKDEDKFTSETAWTSKLKGYMSSPIVLDGHAYLLLENQRFACLRLKDGKECWVSDKTFGKYWSLVARGDRILALDQKGILYLIQASPEKLEILDQRKVSDQETWAHLAVRGDEVFVRELGAVTAYRWLDPK